ncbi:hypothetical protein D3C87_1183220 [compost metagenome]
MKKAVLWMIAAMMILGSLKTFASDDVTAGKLDAVAQDRLENDIQADITEGKIQAAMAEMEQEKLAKILAAQFHEAMALQENFDSQDPDKFIKAFGDQATLANWALEDLRTGKISAKEAKDLAAEIGQELSRLKILAAPYIN